MTGNALYRSPSLCHTSALLIPSPAGRMTALYPSLLAAILYLGGSFISCVGMGKAPGRQYSSAACGLGVVKRCLPTAGQACTLQLFTADGPLARLFHTASLVAWLVIAITLASSFRQPVSQPGYSACFPLALITRIAGLAVSQPTGHLPLVPAEGILGRPPYCCPSWLTAVLTIGRFQATLPWRSRTPAQDKHSHPLHSYLSAPADHRNALPVPIPAVVASSCLNLA